MTHDNNKYLIIGGSTKCGTTSVFKYFEFHPQICKCVMKESRYFLDEDYNLIAKKRDKNEYKKFIELFKNCGAGQIRLEATPDYLYSKNSASKIKEELANVKLIFILREPVDRLMSWYKFSKLNGLIEKSSSFEDYIDVQKKQFNSETPQHLRSLHQGLYSEYLSTYYKLFSTENIKLCYYEDLVNEPENFCKEIAEFAGIDSSYFNNFNFVVHNRSVPVKSVSVHKLFRKFKRTIRPATSMLNTNIRKKLKLAGYKFETLYSNANQDQTDNEIRISTELKSYLNEYYQNEMQSIKNLSGNLPAWNQKQLPAAK